MTWRIELGAAAVTMGAALMWGASADSALDAPRLEQPDHFTHADYQAFDRDFRFGGTVCEVGLKRKGICFGVSPFEDGLSEGQTIPASLPDMPAEFSCDPENRVEGGWPGNLAFRPGAGSGQIRNAGNRRCHVSDGAL